MDCLTQTLNISKVNELLQRIFLSDVLQTVCNRPTKFQAESSKNENNFWKSCEVPKKACIDSHSMTFISPHLGVGRGGVCRTSVSFFLVVNALRLILVEYFQIWSGFVGMPAENTFPIFSIDLHSFSYSIKLSIN